MDRTSEIARWPWRKWLLAGTAMAGSATIVGPVTVEGAFGCSDCAAVSPQCGYAPSTTDGNVNGRDTGAPDGHEDAPPEE
jgi:hypothetical protein